MTDEIESGVLSQEPKPELVGSRDYGELRPQLTTKGVPVSSVPFDPDLVSVWGSTDYDLREYQVPC